jgi:NAD(P)H-hydrate epimerase
MRTLSGSTVPALTTEQMREVDRVMVEDLHIELVQMMENAGRNLAELAITRFSPDSVTVLAGSGGNGGGGLVAARHLANRGCQVQVVLSEPDRLTPVPAHQADILARMGVTMASRPSAAGLVIDALIGYSLRGDPAGTTAELITWANDQTAPVLALDTPSGLDLTTGAAGTPAVGATATLTLALPKVGLLDAPGVGELYLADISVPPLVYQRMGIAVPELFRQSSLLRIDLRPPSDPALQEG